MRATRNEAISYVAGTKARPRPKLMALYREATENGLRQRVSRLYAAATKTWKGDQQAAMTFLTSPNASFGGDAPLTQASSETGTRRVEELLGRVQHGVFG